MDSEKRSGWQTLLGEDPVAELKKDRDGWKREAEQLAKDLVESRKRADALQRVSSVNYWNWQGDGEDYPESLTCPVVMHAEDLRKLLKPQLIDAVDAVLSSPLGTRGTMERLRQARRAIDAKATE